MIIAMTLALAAQQVDTANEAVADETTVSEAVIESTDMNVLAEQPGAEADLALAEPATPAIAIPRDTPVRLMVLNEVSTKDHGVGHKFKLRVNEPVVIDGIERIPVGAMAWGEVLDAEKSGNVGKSGKISARLLHIDLDGREIPIDGETQSEGRSGKGEAILGVLSLGVFGLFAKGNNAKLKAGEMMTAFIADDVTVDALQ